MSFDLSASSLAASTLDVLNAAKTSAQQQNQAAGQAAAASGGADGDTVNISEAAYRRLGTSVIRAEAGASAAGEGPQTVANPWEEYFGIKAGTATLQNGNTQVTTIDGTKMERLEYKDGVLVKKETGTVTGERAVWDTEHYGVGGAVTRKDHVEVTGLGSTESDSVASLRRDVQWFEDGELVRELHDGMHVESASRAATLAEGAELAGDVSLEDMVGALTKDRVHSDYQADIVEYADGKVTRTASIHNRLTAENLTNRESGMQNGLEGQSTVELANANALTVELTNYGLDGKVAMQARLTDSVEAGKSMTQSVAMSWYNKGELVREEEGSLTMTLIPGDGQTLPDRPGILETFGIDETTFSEGAPLSAGGLLAASREETGGAADAFVAGISSDMGGGAFGLAGTLADYRDADTPYRATFSSRTYREGELAAASTDTEEVRQNTLPGVMNFAAGKGLTEDEFPKMLRTSSHEELAYENGERSAQGRLFMREYLQRDDRDVYGLYTHYSGEAGRDEDMESVSGVFAGSLEDLDSDANAATAGLGRAADMAVDGTRALFKGLREN
jgi:hypothetical protein